MIGPRGMYIIVKWSGSRLISTMADALSPSSSSTPTIA